MTEIREDLLRGLLQSCYVIEHARAGVQGRWGGDFDRDASRTLQRAERLGSLLDEKGFRRTEEVVGPHTDWFESLAGSAPDEVPLGAAALHQFGKWAEVYAGPYLDGDIDDFRDLGREHARVELEVRTMNEGEAFLDPTALPQGRRFVVLTDIHVGSRGREVLLRSAIDDINALEPECVVVPGDITEDGELEQFHQAKEILDGLSCPYYAVQGNHDGVQRSTRQPTGDRYFKEAFDVDPVDHVVECGGLQIALVDTTDPTPSPFAEWDLAKGSISEGTPGGIDSGALRDGQAAELASRLDKGKPVLLVQHHELHPFPGFPPVRFALREEDAETELEALGGHNLVGIVAGHTHRSAVLPVGDGSTTQIELPALKDWPYAYTVAGVGEDGVQFVPRQVSNRDAVWKMASRLLPLMRRFHLGPLSDLQATLRF
jgi:hypothetical protein